MLNYANIFLLSCLEVRQALLQRFYSTTVDTRMTQPH